MMGKALHGLLAVALLTALAQGPLHAFSAADVNRDQAVDVLDLQQVIGQVINGAAGDARGDVNGDGAVNILDFQALFSHAQDEDGETQPDRRDLGPGVLQPLKIDMPHHRPVFRSPDLLLASHEADRRQVRHVAIQSTAPLPPRKAVRYALSLTPHAPPQRA